MLSVRKLQLNRVHESVQFGIFKKNATFIKINQPSYSFLVPSVDALIRLT